MLLVGLWAAAYPQVMTAITILPTGSRSAQVDPSWVDIYGHMNMAYYVKLFDDLGHDILADHGLGEAYTRKFGFGLFTVKAAIDYLREVTADAPLTISLTIEKADSKRLWTKLEMRHSEQGYVAATMAQLAVNVSLATRRAVVFPAELDAVLDSYR
ncbi:MAG: thioesterase family protein [Bosea sp. (in: a-proteobacteria)]|nr:thioesterase family protein [Bosea sp. (in: a-proteobacteria)]